MTSEVRREKMREEMRRAEIQRQMKVFRRTWNGLTYHPCHQLHNPYATPKFEEDIIQQNSNRMYEGTDKNKGYGIRLKKIIAHGGFGVAALVEHTSRDNAVTQCVMKVEFARHQDRNILQKEEKAFEKFKGAKHIVQILDLTKKIKAERNASNAKNTTIVAIDQSDENWDIQKQRTRDFILTEFAKHGNLRMWLNKACRSGKPWPDKALWWLFRCLVKGLVGMGYPPLEHHKQNNPDWDSNDPIEEYIPQGSQGPQQTCHFDLDPLNVLVDSDEGHGDFPIFKANDFGETEFYDEIPINPSYFSSSHFWGHRWKGKRHCLTPEQFTAEWDPLEKDGVPDDVFIATDGSKPGVAGNYGMHSNIFQVGIMMWCAITRCKFHYPGTVQYNGYQTYGGLLQDGRFSDVDQELRRLIMACMAHDPSSRPTLANLLSRIEQALQRPGLESDHDTQEWAKEFFNTPRVPGDEPEEVLDTEMAEAHAAHAAHEAALVAAWAAVKKRECPSDDDHEDDDRYRSQRRIGESQRMFIHRRLSGGDFLLSGDPQPAPQELIFDALHNDQPATPAQNAQPMEGIAHHNAQQQRQEGAAVPPHLRHLQREQTQQPLQQQQQGQGGRDAVPPHLRHIARRQMQQQQQQHPERPPSVLPTQKQQRRKQREQRRAKQNAQRQPPAIYGQQQQGQQDVQHPAWNVDAPAFQPQQQFMPNPLLQQQQQQQFGYPNVFYQQAAQQQPQQPQQQQFVYPNVYQHIPAPQQQQFGYQNVAYQYIPPQQLPGGQQVYGFTLKFPQQGHQPPPQ